MQILSQRDRRWADETIGTTPYTVGRWGCAITCISMITDYFNKFRHPGELAKDLTFTVDGKIIWASLPKVGLSLEARIYHEDKARAYAAFKHPEKACILQVENYHWVLLIGKTLTGDYKIADPWTGQKVALHSRYRWVSGLAIIKNI